MEAFIDSFEALTETGTLIIVAQNIGTLTATYQVITILQYAVFYQDSLPLDTLRKDVYVHCTFASNLILPSLNIYNYAPASWSHDLKNF